MNNLNIKRGMSIRLMVLWALMVVSCAVQAQSPGLAIENVTVFQSPFQEPMKEATIVMSQAKILEIGPTQELDVPHGFDRIDGSGKFATAGFWNSHVHLIEEAGANARFRNQEVEDYLKEILTSWGFVYAFDVAQLDFQNLNDNRWLIDSETISGPTIFAVGLPFTSTSPFYAKPIVFPELQHPEEVRAHIRAQVLQGANGVKL